MSGRPCTPVAALGSFRVVFIRLFALLAITFLVNLIKAEDQPLPGRQVERSLSVSDGGRIPYLIYLPSDYTDKGKEVPFILFLHGRGESRGPLSLVTKWGPPRRLDSGEQMKYIVVSPQCPIESRWASDDQQARLKELLAYLNEAYNIDKDRMYLTGLSMGGYGSWRLAADEPKMFAAVAPICGVGDPADAKKLLRVPVWAWHGTDDKSVPFSGSSDMIKAIAAAGGRKARLTTLEHVGHNSWSAAYQPNDLYKWFDLHTASGNN